MRKKTILLLSIMLTCSGFLGFSQDTLRLTLEDAKSYAMENSRTIKKANISVQKAESARWQAISSMLPHIDVSLGYTDYFGFVSMGSSMLAYGDLTPKVSVALSGAQLIGVQISNVAKSMSQINALSDELTIKTSVSSTYYSILVAEESKRILQGNKDNVKKLYESTVQLVKVGMAEQTAADQLEVQVGTMENTIRSVERNIELAYNSLRLILGTDANIPIALTQTLESFTNKDVALSVAGMPLDLNNNYTVQLVNQNLELSKKQVNVNEWAYAPSLSAYYQYTKKTYFDKDAGFDMTPPNVVGVTLSIPIFSSGERYSKVKQSKFDLQTSELEKQETVDGLLVQEKQLRFNLKSAIETYELQKKNLDVYQRIFDKASEKYQYGILSSTDLTTINNNLLIAQNSYISALMEMLTAQINLQKLLNNL